jgi:hypothetical protein
MRWRIRAVGAIDPMALPRRDRPAQFRKVPVLIDGKTSVADSGRSRTGRYLSGAPSLFGGEGGPAPGRMMNWATSP